MLKLVNVFANEELEEQREMLVEEQDNKVEEQNLQLTEDCDSIADDITDLNVATTITDTLTRKAEANDGEISDEEIIIATEAIGYLYSKSNVAFNGFGFEQYAGRTLTQKEKTEIALEAITNQNKENTKGLQSKIENMGNGISDYFSWYNGDMSRLKNDAETVLNRVMEADDTSFGKSDITDKRVSLAFQRGKKEKPFSSYKDVLKALKGNIDSLKVLSSASKYESLGSGKGSEYDLAKLAEDLSGKIIAKTATSATYDLNPEMLTGTSITLKIPNNSESGYIMRNLKANFVVSSKAPLFRLTEKSQGVNINPLNKKECVALLKDVINHIKEEEYLFKLYYKDAKVDFVDTLKNIGKTMVGVFLLGYNSMIFRGRIQELNTKIHYINRRTLRGLIALAASSLD